MAGHVGELPLYSRVRLTDVEHGGQPPCGSTAYLDSFVAASEVTKHSALAWRDARNESGGDCRDVGMTQIDEQTDQHTEQQFMEYDVSEDRELSAAEVMAWRRDDVFLPEAEATQDQLPHLSNISAGFLFGGVVRPNEPAPPEYVTLAMPRTSDREFVAVAQWNMRGKQPSSGDASSIWTTCRSRWRRSPTSATSTSHSCRDTGAVLRVRAAVSPPVQARPRHVRTTVATWWPVAVHGGLGAHRRLPAAGFRSAACSRLGVGGVAAPDVGVEDQGVLG